jgi:hypothetical protein
MPASTMPVRLGTGDAIAVAGIVVLAALLRFPRLDATPGWDGDEAYNLDIAWHLLQGERRAFALSQSFVQHPILFYASLAPWLGIFGRELWVARAVVAAVGSLTAGLVYLAAVLSLPRRAAVFASFAFAGAHFIVLHNRLAYTYNLLLFWSAATLLCVVVWEQRRQKAWLIAAGVAAALGLLTDQVGVALPLFVAARVLPRGRLALASLLTAIAPAVAFAVVMYVLDPRAVAQDWQQSLRRVTAAGPVPDVAATAMGLATRLAVWLSNYLHLLRAEWWWPAAIVGLFTVRLVIARRRLLLLFGLMVLPTFALREIDPFFRTAIPLFLPGALGLGALLDAGVTAVYSTFGVALGSRSRRAMDGDDGGRPTTGDRTEQRRPFVGVGAGSSSIWPRLAAAAVVAFAVVLPLGLELGRSFGALVAGFESRIDWAMVTTGEQADARAAARFVNDRIRTTDVIITSPHVGWLFDGRVADFFQAVAWTGDPIAFYPAGTYRSRFSFDPSSESARFAVIDEFWEQWREVSPPLARLTRAIEAWPEVARSGQFRVYMNPSPSPSL